MRIWVLMAMLGLAPATGRADIYDLEKRHTRILFFVPHLGMSKLPGQFHDVDGRLDYDPAHPEKSSVTVTIQAASVDMDDKPLYDKLIGADFFRAAEFPQLKFVSTGIERTGESTGLLHGNLTLLGVTRPVTLAATLNKAGPHPMLQRPALGVSATGSLKRSDFGMNWGQGLIGDEIEIRIELEAIARPCAPVSGARGGGC